MIKTINAFSVPPYQSLTEHWSSLKIECGCAGIIGLTPTHTVTYADKQALLDYLRNIHRPQAEKIFTDERPIESQIIVAETVIEDLLKLLAKEPQSVYRLPPRKFEELVARILEDQGCEVTLTKTTLDGGYDILGRLTTGPVPLVFLTECKRYSENNRAGVEVVRNLYGVTEMQRANFGMIVTTSSFTKDAQEEKMRIGSRIDLKEFNDLKSWFERYKSNLNIR